MYTAEVEWSGYYEFEKIKDESEKYFDEKGFYMIFSCEFNNYTKKYDKYVIKYIGKAYKQSAGKRIAQWHQSYDKIKTLNYTHPDWVFYISVGILKSCKSEDDFMDKKTAHIYDDVESCLIFDNQPDCNDKKKDSYNGRDLTVINSGKYLPMKKISICKIKDI